MAPRRRHDLATTDSRYWSSRDRYECNNEVVATSRRRRGAIATTDCIMWLSRGARRRAQICAPTLALGCPLCQRAWATCRRCRHAGVGTQIWSRHLAPHDKSVVTTSSQPRYDGCNDLTTRVGHCRKIVTTLWHHRDAIVTTSPVIGPVLQRNVFCS